MRTMFDGIIPGSVPAGAQLYAAYLDGRWPDYVAMVARFPTAVHVSIAVSAGYDGGVVLDVETGDATPAESVTWVLMRRAAGIDPSVYCNTSTWTSVKNAFRQRGVAEPHYWVADYSLGPNPQIPAGAVALQYADRGGYDESIVADYWPGVDPAPTPQGADDMTPAQAAQLAQILQLVTDNFNADFSGGTSMGPVQPGAPNNSIAATLAAIGAQVQKISAPQVDATALAAALAANTTFVNGVAAAVVAQIGTDLKAGS